MTPDLLFARVEALWFRRRNALRSAGVAPGESPPFIYIGALRRTGSTLLTELLTSPPHCFVFHEPGLAESRFRVDPRTIALLLELEVDLEGFQSRWCHRRRLLLMGAFKYELLPQLASRISQIGVKEVAHDRWRRYLLRFPGMKTLLTARDPRDIYLSIHQRRQQGKAIWHGEFTPGAVAAELDAQFQHQLEIFDSTDSLRVRYEDLCTDDSTWGKVKAFTGSTIPEVGAVGGHLAATSNRSDEVELHAGEVTTRRVNRWKDEPDARLREEAQQTLELMPKFCEFWGYGE